MARWNAGHWFRWLALSSWLACGLIVGCLTGEIGEDPSTGGHDAGGQSAGGADASGGMSQSGGASQGGGGSSGACQSPADCPGIDGDCQSRSCVDGLCGMAQARSGDACDEQGGQVCDGIGACVECVDAGDCLDGICQTHQCVPATCNDGTQNGDESALDCGGSCAPCGNGLGCVDGGDCTSGHCDGGSCAPCSSDGHCGGGRYCNQGTCVDKKVDGDVCSAQNQCLSGFCPAADGVCCGSACSATCRACLSVKTGAANGVCADITLGLDPEGECPDQGAATCGTNGTGCNGNGACRLYTSGTPCGAPSCSGGQQTTASLCNGNGSCTAGSSSSCAPYVCGGQSCLTSCSGNTQCQSGYECQSSQCQLPGCIGGNPVLDSEEQAFLVLINNHRANNGLGPLSACTSLNRAAQGHSDDMRDNNFLSHTGTGNTTFTQRACAACYTQACPLATAMGENVACGNSGAQGTFNQWLNSPGHNANMLSGNYTRIGIGRATGGVGCGGSYWTNVFAGANEASCN